MPLPSNWMKRTHCYSLCLRLERQRRVCLLMIKYIMKIVLDTRHIHIVNIMNVNGNWKPRPEMTHMKSIITQIVISHLQLRLQQQQATAAPARENHIVLNAWYIQGYTLSDVTAFQWNKIHLKFLWFIQNMSFSLHISKMFAQFFYQNLISTSRYSSSMYEYEIRGVVAVARSIFYNWRKTTFAIVCA